MASFDSQDLEKNKITGGIGYLLFFVPLIACPSSRFGRFCANQGLLVVIVFLALWLANALLSLILGWIPFVGGLINILFNLARIAASLLALYYTYLAMAKGDARPLPVIGGYSLIK